ncbi:MAG: TRAP transporter substrate-binding protein [Smithellaceae bacterium]|nr:TRAP transporter substrate-binding protein [Smithellaceae bacterium]
MMKVLKLGFVSLIAVLFALSVTGAAFAQDKKTIRIGSPFRAGHILVEAAEKFKAAIERDTGGRFMVELQVGTVSEEVINDLCSRGAIEMQSNGHRALEIFAPQYFFFNAPYVMKDFDHFMRVWEGGPGKKAIELVEKNGNVTYLGIVYRGLRQTTSKKPVYTPADVYGLKLRLPTVKTWIAVWKEMDAAPVPIPLPELYKSLKEGTAEASEGDLTQITSFKLDEVQTHLTLTNHLVQTGGMMINKSFFESLSREDQGLIRKAIKEATDFANDKIKKGETSLLIELQRKGMTIVIPDAEMFREKGKPAVEELFAKEWPVTTWKEVLAQ